MNKQGKKDHSWFIEHASLAAAAITLCVGASVLIGWALDVAPLKTVFPGLVTMKANTALGFVVAGISLWAASTGGRSYSSAVISRVSGCCVALLGILTILEYLTGEDFGIDQFFIQETTNLPGDIPGRMAFNTAVSFALTGSALALIDLRKKGVVPAIHFLAAAVMLIAGTALVGYAFSIEAFMRVKLHYTPMAVHTALAFVLLGLGIISFRPDFPFYRMMTSAAPADRMVRGLLPAVIGLPFVTGWVISKLYHAGSFSDEVGFALFAAATVVGLCAVVQWNAGSLYKADARREQLEEEVQRHREIAERQKVEEEIQKIADSLNEAQRMAHIGSWELDLVNNSLRWSDEIYRIFEIDPSRFGASYEAFLDAVHPDDKAAVHEAYVNSVKNRTTYAIDHRLLFPDGRIKYVHERGETFYDQHGNPFRSIGTVQDISEQKQTEAELNRVNEALKRHSAELEAANTELSAFAYTASHVLRAPLRGINGYSRILLDDFNESLNEEGRRLLKAVSRNAIEMNQYLDDLLSYSNIGRREVRPVSVDMENTARGVAAELESAVAGRRVHFEIKTLPPAYGDKQMMRQVFFNLLSNSVKFTRRIDDAVIDVGAQRRDGEEIIYYVRDNGVGFDMQYKDKLFGVFRRLHGDEEFEGTGIGLAIVKRIIDKHGGRVWAEGKAGAGATFYFTLPKGRS